MVLYNYILQQEYLQKPIWDYVIEGSKIFFYGLQPTYLPNPWSSILMPKPPWMCLEIDPKIGTNTGIRTWITGIYLENFFNKNFTPILYHPRLSLAFQSNSMVLNRLSSMWNISKFCSTFHSSTYSYWSPIGFVRSPVGMTKSNRSPVRSPESTRTPVGFLQESNNFCKKLDSN